MPKNKVIDPNLFRIGTMMKQGTSFVHIVKEGNNKIWQRIKPCKKYYMTIGNVGRPFFIRIFENTIDIYTNINIEKYPDLSWY